MRIASGPMEDAGADDDYGDDSADEAAVRAANRAFYDAFEARDLDAMSDVWEHDDRVSCTHPGWRTLHGWGAVSGSWFALFGGPSPLQFILTDEVVAVAGDAAWVTVDENLISADGRRHGGGGQRVPAPRRSVAARRPPRLGGGAPGLISDRGTTLQPPCKKLLPPTAGPCARCGPARPSSTPRSALLEDGDLRPTAPRVAERGARCRCGAIFQHFDDLETLHAAVAERLVERVAVLRAPGRTRPAARCPPRPVRAPAGAAARGRHARSAAPPTCTARSRRRSPPACATARRSCARSSCAPSSPSSAAAGDERDESSTASTPR